MRPTINERVHYVARGSADGRFPSVCRAAVVTEVGLNKAVGLCVLNPTGFFFHALTDGGGIMYHEGIQADSSPGAIGALCDGGDLRYAPGTWHRPAVAE